MRLFFLAWSSQYLLWWISYSNADLLFINMFSDCLLTITQHQNHYNSDPLQYYETMLYTSESKFLFMPIGAQDGDYILSYASTPISLAGG